MRIDMWVGEEVYPLMIWFKLTEREVCHSRLRQNLITMAIEHYIKTKKYICIGKINLNLHKDEDTNCRRNVQLNLKKNSLAEKWFEEYKKTVPKGTSTLLKEILMRSLMIVDDDTTKDWIPTSYSIPIVIESDSVADPKNYVPNWDYSNSLSITNNSKTMVSETKLKEETKKEIPRNSLDHEDNETRSNLDKFLSGLGTFGNTL